jgi:hypothetical protein
MGFLYWPVLELGSVPCSTIFGTYKEAFGIIIFTMLSVSPTKIERTVKEK